MNSQYGTNGTAAGPEPIAIVGMGCRWPGGVRDASGLWELLKNKRSGYREFGDHRFSRKGFHHPNSEHPGTVATEGGFLLAEDPRLFDHAFFGIGSLEVETMDPSQRKLLEVVYEAFENSGEDTDHPRPYASVGTGTSILSNRVNYIFNLRGPSVTIDTACSSSMYALHLAISAIRNGDCDSAIVAASNTIIDPSTQLMMTKLGVLSPTSTSHTFDSSADGYARGEGFSALYLKRISTAVDGEYPIRALVRGSALNANGRTGGITHPGREGQEAVIRKAYENAGNLPLEDTTFFECHGTGTPVGDPIEISAIGNVFGSATTPEKPLLVGSIKTNIGHTEPASAIAGIMKVVLALENGFIPPSIGIKKLNPKIDLKAGRINILTENTPWPEGRVRRASVNSFGYGGANGHCIIDDVRNVLPDYKKRTAKTSNGHANGYTNGVHASNGYNGHHQNGTNGNDASHMVEEARKVHYPFSHAPTLVKDTNAKSRRRVLIPFSAHNETSLGLNIAAISEAIERENLADVAYTLTAKRSRFMQRTFRIVDSESPADGFAVKENVLVSGTQTARLGFIFTGQGAQWHAMGVGLFEYAVFRTSIEYLDSILASLPTPSPWKIKDILAGDCDPNDIHKPEVSQTVCTAVQIGLVDLLYTWNVKASAVAGHSSGEIAATYAAGRITAAQAIAAAYFRGQAVAKNKRKGLMLAVGLGPEKAEAYISGLESSVRIAAVNSPDSVTLSGDESAIKNVAAKLNEDKVFNRELKTGGNAYHSHHMFALGEPYNSTLSKGLDYVKSLGQAEPSQLYPTLPWMSSVYPSKSTENLPVSPSYWRANLESPVRFSEALANMLNLPDPIDVLVEIGPHPALKGPIGQISRSVDKSLPYFSALNRGTNGEISVLKLAGSLFSLNAEVDLTAVNAVDVISDSRLKLVHGTTATNLPPYQYAYGPVIYHESRFSKEFRGRNIVRHDLLGSKLPGNAKLRPQWRNILRLKDLPWLEDHKLLPHPVFPAAGYIATVIEAASRIYNEQSERLEITGYNLRNINFSSAMRLPDDDFGLEIITSLELADAANPKAPTWATFSISSVAREAGTWTEHCSGRVKVIVGASVASEKISTEMDARTLDTKAWYKKFAEIGLGYGPTFQPLSNIRADPSKGLAVAQLALHSTRDTVEGGESSYPLHPASLDAVFQLSLVASHGGQIDRVRSAFVPVHIDQLHVRNGISQESAFAIALGEMKGLRSAHAKLQVLDESERVVLDVGNLRCVTYTEVLPSAGADKEAFSNPFLRLSWKPDIRAMDNEQVRRRFPPPKENVEKAYLFDKLERLGTLYVAEIHERYAGKGQFSSAPAHIDNFLSWVRRRTTDDNEWVAEANSLTSFQRCTLIKELFAEVGHISDVKIAKKVFNNMEAILSERKTGLDVVIQDNLLHGMYEDGLIMTGAYPQLVRFFDLFGYVNPNMRILEIGAGTGGATRKILKTLTGPHGIKRYQDYTFTDISSGFLAQARDAFADFQHMEYSVLDIQEDPLEHGYEAVYDVVVACECLHATPSIVKTLANCRKLVKPGGKLVVVENTRAVIGHGLVLGHLSGYWDGIPDGRVESPFLHLEGWNDSLNKTGFAGAELVLDDYPAPYTTARTIISSAIEEAKEQKVDQSQGRTVHLVHGDNKPKLLSRIERELTERGIVAKVLSIGDVGVHLPDNSRVVAFADGKSLLVNASEIHLMAFKALIRKSANLVWVTFGGIVNGHDPDASITTGLLRTLGTENPTSQFLSIDVSPDSDSEDIRLTRTILDQELALSDRVAGESRDYEFVWQQDCLWVSRLVPDAELQDKLELSESRPSRAEMLPLDSQGSVRAAFETPGLLTSLYFKPYEETWKPLPDDWIQVKVAAVGLNWKDLLTSAGRFDMNTFSSEYSGVVAQVGLNVTNVAVGDRVYGYGRGHFGNYVRAPANFAYRMQPGEDFVKMATIPLVGMTSVYSFEHVTQLKERERLLIQSATGGLGLSAIQLAKAKGAEIFATAGTPEKRRYLIDVAGIPASRVFSSRDPADTSKLMQATNGKGFNVILSTSSGELLYDSVKMLAPMGRIVDVGRLDVQNSTSLALELFKRNATFTSFDLAVADDLDPALGPSLMATVNQRVRAGQMGPLSSITTYDVSQLDQALMAFSKGTHIGKLVVTFQNPNALVKMVPAAPRAQFARNANYLITGGLGGLGRSIINFMAERGAGHFTVMSRSRKISSEGQILIDKLAASGTVVECVSCDVSCSKDVARVVQAAATFRPIRGIVHAAVSYQDLSFDKLTIEQWTSALAAKVQGTKNLHEATKFHELDFFLMTTTIESFVALATQSAYTAANNFQDYFARWRRQHGLPASTASFGLISDVGHLSTNSTTLALMARNKVMDISEYNFLRLLEPAFLNNEPELHPATSTEPYSGAVDDPLSMTNVVTCFDPATMAARKLEEAARNNGNTGSTPRWYTDARVSLIMRAFDDAERYQASADGGDGGNERGNNAGVASLRGEFEEAVKAGPAERSRTVALVTDAIVKTVAQMLFVDASGVDASRTVADYGVDSLIAAELRNWFNVAFGVDVSMLEMLDTATSMKMLANKIVDGALA
ncbi:polyketide synthase [Byssothecium circinans]|uniref:Polyketide synthase n=1 Tax=Byssothecium circinans TaxID=147558 RepID=A0A6A5TUJ6_9PLEO|nr:polyketide synthase [Byssothecium circinans]